MAMKKATRKKATKKKAAKRKPAARKKATKKYKKSVGAEHFQLFALDFIEKNMDGAGAGFFSRLFKS